MPPIVGAAGVRYEWVQTFKHDFFAATGLYRAPDGRLAVLKVGRITDAFSLPLRWIGRWLTARERALYELLDGTPGVPRYVGAVGTNGFLHEYVPGRPLGRDDAVADAFFPQLESLLETLHRQNIAYIDLNKRQNVLLGEDGRPYLIDFQISLRLRPGFWRRFAPARWLLRRFQKADRYHFLKHKRRLRPDQMSADETAAVQRLSAWIRLHRWISHPLRQARRRTLKRLERSETVEVVGSSAK